MQEMRESIKIAFQCLNALPDGEVKIDNPAISPVSKFSMLDSMENTIQRFKYYSENVYFPEVQSYTAIEAPKGENGVFL
jgi:NADH:ubiquinone oxidoreductase subunit D